MITYDKPIKQIVELKWESVVHGGGSGCVGEGGGGAESLQCPSI